MITTEYSVAGPADISIAIVADLHEFEPKPVLSRLAEIRPDVIAVPGDLFENCPRTRKMRKPCPHKKVVSLHCEKTNPRIKRGHNQDLVTIDDLVLL